MNGPVTVIAIRTTKRTWWRWYLIGLVRKLLRWLEGTPKYYQHRPRRKYRDNAKRR